MGRFPCSLWLEWYKFLQIFFKSIKTFVWLNLTPRPLKYFGINWPSAFFKTLKFWNLSQNRPNQACNYWSITPNQHFALKLITAGNYKSGSGKLQNNTVDGAMLVSCNVWLDVKLTGKGLGFRVRVFEISHLRDSKNSKFE